MSARRPHGISLVELMIATFLFGLTAVLIALLVRSGFRYLRDTANRAELQRTSLFILSNLSREITESSPDCVRYSGPSEPPGLVFATPRGANDLVEYANNHLQWKKWVCVYWDQNERRLIRTEDLFTAPTPFKPDPSPAGLDKSVSSFANTVSSGRTILARNITDFSAEGDREVRLTLQTEVGEGENRSTLTTRTAITLHH